MLDVRGLETTAASDAAVRNFDATLAQYLRFGLGTGDCLKRTLAEDPEMALAHCVKGYFFMLFCVPALAVKARASLEAGRRSAAERGATERERRHLDALDAWSRGEFEEAVSHLEVILAAHPRDILALKLAHYLYFYLGDDANHRDSIGRVLHAWDDTVDGYGYVLGMHAFALEESGAYAEAEQAGRAAVERNPADLWAVHAVA
ncbi:MAG: tetratricopeptide repeat protein, partial [Gammaproteobacteria bacterium]|nr:tetratricopeptide repeat protein [Gammaproteobacteria bacterium]